MFDFKVLPPILHGLHRITFLNVKKFWIFQPSWPQRFGIQKYRLEIAILAPDTYIPDLTSECLTSILFFNSCHNLKRWVLLFLSLLRGGNTEAQRKKITFSKGAHLVSGRVTNQTLNLAWKSAFFLITDLCIVATMMIRKYSTHPDVLISRSQNWHVTSRHWHISTFSSDTRRVEKSSTWQSKMIC